MRSTGSKFVYLAFSVLGLIGAFLPVASADSLFVNAGHIGGVAYLLYILPLGAIAISVVNIYKENIRYIKVWFIAIGITGILVGVLVANAGIGHLNEFTAMQTNLQQERESFQRNFDENWKSFGDSSDRAAQPVQPKQEGQRQANAPSVPRAKVGIGVILFAIGNLGLVITNLISPTGKTIAATAVLMSLIAGNALAEEPKPFGLALGKSTRSDVNAVIQNEGGKITKSGNLVIEGDIINQSVDGIIVEGLKMDGLSDATFWLYNETLYKITYRFSSSMGHEEFATLFDQLRAKYGKPRKYKKPYLSDGLAEWSFKPIDVNLYSPWVGSSMSLAYVHESLNSKVEMENKRIYNKQTRAKAKTQKGF